MSIVTGANDITRPRPKAPPVNTGSQTTDTSGNFDPYLAGTEGQTVTPGEGTPQESKTANPSTSKPKNGNDAGGNGTKPKSAPLATPPAEPDDGGVTVGNTIPKPPKFKPAEPTNGGAAVGQTLRIKPTTPITGPNAWQRFAPDSINVSGNQVVNKKRGDIVLREMIENGAPAEVIADFLNKNQDAIDASSGWIQDVVKKVNKALNGTPVDIKTGQYSKKTAKTTRISSVLERQLQNDPEALKAWRKGGQKGLSEYVDQKAKDIAAQNRAISEKNRLAGIQDVSAGMLDKQWFANQIKNQPVELQNAFAKGGFEAYNAAVEKYNAKTKKEYDAAVRKFESDLKSQDPEGFKIYQSHGLEAYQAYAAGKSAQYNFQLQKMNPYLDKAGNIDVAKYLWSNKDLSTLKFFGVTDEDIQKARVYNAYSHSVGEWVDQKMTEDNQPTWEDLRARADVTSPNYDPKKDPTNQDWNQLQKNVQEKQAEYYSLVPAKKPLNVIKEVGLSMIPVYGTYRYYQQAKVGGFSKGEITMLGLSVLADLMFIVPAVGAVSAGARGTFTAGRIGGMEGAILAGRDVAIAEIKAPFTMLAHPVESLKAAGGSIETVFRKAKIPLSSFESYFSTTRVPVKLIGSAEDAKNLQDAVTTSLIEGRQTEAAFSNGAKVELRPTALNKLGTPAAVHMTPDIRPYLDGAELDMLYVAPRGSSRFGLATSSGFVPEDGIKGGLIIRDEKALRELASSNIDSSKGLKIYKGTAEVEKIIPKYNLGKPVQTLISRTPQGEKLTMLVFGKEFTNAELAKMKFIGALDTVTQIFTKDIKATRASELYNEASDTAKQVRIAEQSLKEAKDPETAAKIRSQIQELNQQLDRQYRASMDAYRKLKMTPSMVLINTARQGPLEKWRLATGARRNTGSVTPYRLPPARIPTRVSPTVSGTRQAPSGTGRSSIPVTPVRTSIAVQNPRSELPAPPKRETITPPTDRKPPAAPKTRTTPMPPGDRQPPAPPKDRKPPEPPGDRKPPAPPKDRIPPEPPRGKLPPEPPKKRPVPKITVLRGGGKKNQKPLSEADIANAKVWKQGVGYWAIIIRDGKIADYRFFKKPPRGMTIYPDEKTAAATIQNLIGADNRPRTLDLGIEDIKITPRAGGKRPNIRFSLDRHQRTKGEVSLRNRGGGNFAKNERVGKLYRVKTSSGTLVSRKRIKARRR